MASANADLRCPCARCSTGGQTTPVVVAAAANIRIQESARGDDADCEAFRQSPRTFGVASVLEGFLDILAKQQK